MKNQDIRWQQRLNNFEKALGHLEDALNISQPDIIQKAGLIQFFEMSFELAWNTLKDYLEEQGFADVKTPRAAIKKGFEIGLIQDGRSWLQLLENRNLTSHAYDERAATEIEMSIRQNYFALLLSLFNSLKALQP
ncbi:MAG: nucleotidyltransferase substrate binding protein [Ignavibacteriae bacterium]|nr:nucleotidyltransferase substrate binding protein [Ignavibacteriota bacterium]